MMYRTKIIATWGPSVDTFEKMYALAQAGMSVLRINCSHLKSATGDHPIRLVRKVEKKIGRPLAIMIDLQGPKIRVGDLAKPLILEPGQEWTLSETAQGDSQKRVIPVPLKGLKNSVNIGGDIYFDDGLFRVTILSKNSEGVRVKVIHGGELHSRKGVNIPFFRGNIPAITRKDRQDLIWGLKHQVDFVALSFVRSSRDIIQLRKLIRAAKPQVDPLIVAKIEKPEALDDLVEITAESDGVLVARGDLGIELPPEKVPVAQKMIIENCRRLKKPVIVATQMLDSMRYNPVPTRAESSDVASAIFAGSDAVLLTGETSSGRYPIEACSMMNKIIGEVESHLVNKDFRKRPSDFGVVTLPEAIAFNTMQLAGDIDAKALVILTRRGLITRILSKMHPRQPFFTLASDIAQARRHCLFWGVFPLDIKQRVLEKRIDVGVNILKKNNVVKKGERIIFVFRDFGSDNLNMKIFDVR